MGRRTNSPIANPFYAVLVVVGVLFFITSCAYGVMAFRAVTPRAQTADGEHDHPLINFLDQHGAKLLAGELALLALATFAAMGTDDYWTRRASPPPSGGSPDDHHA